MAIRPRTLPAAISPVLVGWAITFWLGRWQPGPAFATLAVGLLIQIATNLVNDVVDFQKGTDTGERLGPTRVTQAGLLSPKQVWLGGVLAIALAGAAGLYLFTVAGWPVLAIGLASIFGCLIYSAGPYSLTNLGLGDLFVMVFFGFVALCGTVFVMAGEVPAAAWICALAMGALITNILVVNNLRDMETDRQAKRRSIPVLFGRKAAEGEYALMLALAYGVPLVLALGRLAPIGCLLALLTLPNAIRLWREIRTIPAGRGMNRLLGATAQQALYYGLCLSVGIASGVWF